MTVIRLTQIHTVDQKKQKKLMRILRRGHKANGEAVRRAHIP